jgi:hypothetical protein
MKELTRFLHYSHALRLQQALTSAGVEATITSEAANAYIGTVQFTVWIADRADPALVKRVCESLPALDGSKPEPKATWVSIADGLTACSCGYDLRGQTKDGNCPECGRPYVLAPEKCCPKCGEKIPIDFDVCWKCGVEIPPEPTSSS